MDTHVTIFSKKEKLNNYIFIFLKKGNFFLEGTAITPNAHPHQLRCWCLCL